MIIFGWKIYIKKKYWLPGSGLSGSQYFSFFNVNKHFSSGCVFTWCSVIDIVFSEGCVWAYLNTFWHGSTVITAHTISLQRLSHFFWRCVSTLCIVMDIVFSKGCASTVITANSILLPVLSPFSWGCVNLVQCYRYSILRRVCISISKLTWVNCDHCSL